MPSKVRMGGQVHVIGEQFPSVAEFYVPSGLCAKLGDALDAIYSTVTVNNFALWTPLVLQAKTHALFSVKENKPERKRQFPGIFVVHIPNVYEHQLAADVKIKTFYHQVDTRSDPGLNKLFERCAHLSVLDALMRKEGIEGYEGMRLTVHIPNGTDYEFCQKENMLH